MTSPVSRLPISELSPESLPESSSESSSESPSELPSESSIESLAAADVSTIDSGIDPATIDPATVDLTTIDLTTEDHLLDGIMQASQLQQSGQETAAIALYQDIVAADPDGQYGAMARKALEVAGQPVDQDPTAPENALEMAQLVAWMDTLENVSQPLGPQSLATPGLGSAEEGSGGATSGVAGGVAEKVQAPVNASGWDDVALTQKVTPSDSVARKQGRWLGLSAAASVLGCALLSGLFWQGVRTLTPPDPTSPSPTATAQDGLNSSLSSSFQKLQQLQLRLLLQGALVAMILGGIHWAIARQLNQAIVIRLRQLQQSAQQLAQGTRDQPLDIPGEDEMAQLAQVFNQMAANISTIRQYQEQLVGQKRQEVEEQRREAERLQKRVMELLLEIDGARLGNLTVRARVTDDEMGSVADAFNSAIASLQALVLQVQDVAVRVDKGVATSDQSVAALTQAATQQAQSMANALQSVEGMSDSIEAVAATAAQAAAISRQASEAANAGGSAMDQTVESINALRGSVAETAKKVKHLTESSQEISKIVALISEVSAKTNLLAFNASIEAVRAGEHGQGFRLVADEVRRLAEQVTQATQDIEQLVTGIQLETAEVLTMMERGTEQVVTGSQLVSHTRGTLSSLVQTNQEIDAMLQSISTSTASQTAVSATVSATMQAVVDLAQNSSQESARVSEILCQLVELSQQLQRSVDQFQVRS